MEKDRVYDFLGGLNFDFEVVRKRVLNKDPLPSILEVFAYIKREENHKGR